LNTLPLAHSKYKNYNNYLQGFSFTIQINILFVLDKSLFIMAFAFNLLSSFCHGFCVASPQKYTPKLQFCCFYNPGRCPGLLTFDPSGVLFFKCDCLGYSSTFKVISLNFGISAVSKYCLVILSRKDSVIISSSKN